MEQSRPPLVTQRKKRKDMSDMEKLTELLEFAEAESSWFDASFINSLEEASTKNWFTGFTQAQSRALDNMYEKFIENRD